jgi:hypothetical protein
MIFLDMSLLKSSENYANRYAYYCLISSNLIEHMIQQTYLKLYGAKIQSLSWNNNMSWPKWVDATYLFSFVSYPCAAACFFLVIVLNFWLLSLIYVFNSNSLIILGLTYPSIFFVSLVWFKQHMNTKSFDFLLYCSKHLKWENICNTCMHQIVMIVMLSILRQQIVCSSQSSTCRSKFKVLKISLRTRASIKLNP